MQYNDKNATTYPGENFSTQVILNIPYESLFCNIRIEFGNLVRKKFQQPVTG